MRLGRGRLGRFGVGGLGDLLVKRYPVSSEEFFVAWVILTIVICGLLSLAWARGGAWLDALLAATNI